MNCAASSVLTFVQAHSSHKPSLLRCVRNRSSRRPNFPARALAGRNAQKNRSCKCPFFRSSKYVEITCPSCTWRSGSARRPRSPWRFPTCKLSWVRRSGASVQPTGRPRWDTHTGHMLKVWCWPRSVRRRSWPWRKNPISQALNRAMGPWSCRDLGKPPSLLSGASRT